MATSGSVYLFSLISSLCVLFGINFLLRSKKMLLTRILGIQLLILGFLVAASFFILPENLLQNPHFFRVLAPFHYLLPPLNFLFFWYLLHPNEKFNKYYLLLFIPFGFQFLEYLPFYFTSEETKIEEIKWMITQGNFFAFSPRFMWIEPIFHNTLKFIFGTVLCLVMLWYYLKFRLDKNFEKLFQKPLLHGWIVGIVIFRVGLILYASYLHAFTELGKFETPNYIFVAEFFNIIYLILYPTLLDVNFLSENLNSTKEDGAARVVKNQDQLYQLASKIEVYFEETQVYLNSQLTVQLLGKFTGYPHRLISLAIKHRHGVSFRDYLNRIRIAHFEEILFIPENLSKSSIDSLIKDSGFGSRQSFYTAFKKEKGCTPKEYISLKKGD